MQGCQCIVRTQPRPTTKRTRQEVLFVDGCQHLGHAALKGPILNTRHAQGTFLLFAGLGDIHSPNRRCAISLPVYRFEHRLHPVPEFFLRLRHSLAITSGSRVPWNRTKALPHPLSGDMMRQRCEPELGFTPSFRCYLFQFRFHDWQFLSLYRGPNPSIEWSPCFP